jgi:hypothetical protein
LEADFVELALRLEVTFAEGAALMGALTLRRPAAGDAAKPLNVGGFDDTFVAATLGNLGVAAVPVLIFGFVVAATLGGSGTALGLREAVAVVVEDFW